MTNKNLGCGTDPSVRTIAHIREHGWHAERVFTWTEDGRQYRATIDGRLRVRPADGFKTIDHTDPASHYVELAASGLLESRSVKGGRWIEDCAGQMVYRILESDDPDARQIVDIWDRWHLNGMNARCRHMIDDDERRASDGQPARWPISSRTGEPDTIGVAHPECGYRNGSGWLIELLPADVALRWRDLFGIQGLPGDYFGRWAEQGMLT